VVLNSFSFGFVVISALLSLPIALILLMLVVEPRRRAKGREPLGYYGCILYVAGLCVLLLPVGFGLYLLARQGLGIFQ
jgi:Ca2+/Na+ antiporter